MTQHQKLVNAIEKVCRATGVGITTLFKDGQLIYQPSALFVAEMANGVAEWLRQWAVDSAQHAHEATPETCEHDCGCGVPESHPVVGGEG